MTTASAPLRDGLRQMLALLEGERQALAALDLERIVTCADGKQAICNTFDGRGPELDEECRGLLDAVKRMNEVNRKLRNLLAANVQARLSSLTGNFAVYEAARAPTVRELYR
ncbi:MAG TPA: flagellar protein FlgN [Croceibacterium sp.]